MLFLYFIDHAARMLRPVSIVACVATDGLAVIDSMYPRLTSHPPLVGEPPSLRGRQTRTVAHEGNSGVLLAVNVPELLAAARRCQGVVEVVPQVGDFVAVDEPLFVLYGGTVALDDRTLRTLVAFGGERTIDQDPTFAFRILVDIALKALSAAINDPTTAVLAIDQLHRLLRAAGLRFLLGDVITDADGEMRCDLSDAELGGTSCNSPFAKYADAARVASRSLGGCERWERISYKRCQSIVMQRCAPSWSCWTGRSRRSSSFRKTEALARIAGTSRAWAQCPAPLCEVVGRK